MHNLFDKNNHLNTISSASPSSTPLSTNFDNFAGNLVIYYENEK